MAVEAERKPRRARVVVDAASLAHGVGEVVGAERQFQPPALDRLVDLLRRVGFEAESLEVVLPLSVVNVSPTSNIANARWSVNKWISWVGAPAPLMGPVPTFHSGAFDGTREVGCDELMAWVALEQCGEIESDPDAVVLVVSSDSDLQVLHEYAMPTRVIYVGSFTKVARDVLIESRAEFVTLGKHALRHLDPSQSYVDDLECRYYSAEETPRVLRDPVVFDGVRSVAVVDSYGMRNAAARAIGVARTPTIESVRESLGAIHAPSPTAVLSVIPDLSRRHSYGVNNGLAEAWWLRDAELDAIAEQHDQDDDPTTNVRRGEIRLNVGGSNETPIARPTIKRVSTNVVAEIWWSLRHLPEAQVVVMSEDPGIAWLLAVHSADDRFRRVTRVGLHARRLKVVDGWKPPTTPPATVVLTESLAARLVGVSDLAFGAKLRRRLIDSIVDGTTWSVVALDPETGGLVVRPSDNANGEPPVEVVLQPGRAVPEVGRLTWALNRLKKRATEQFTISLVADDSMACAAPEVVVRVGRNPTTRVSAKVVERDATKIDVDVDGDGVADHRLHAGHLTGSLRVGDEVTLAAERNGSSQRMWFAGPSTGESEESPPEWVVVDRAGAETGRSDDGTEGKLIMSPGLPETAGRCLALRLPDIEGPSWLVLSTSLHWSDSSETPIES